MGFLDPLPGVFTQVTILFSDRGIPKSYRHMHGFGSHTYSFLNEANERVWVKFHFRTEQGIENMTEEESANMIGQDRESHQRDLFESVDRGDFPRWKVYVQIMTQAEADGFRWNPFDLTKVWPHAEFPLVEIGLLELNRNPENYFAEVEQASFKPSNFVPGINASPDKMLQARLMSYADAHLYRLGANHMELPVNKPRCPINHYQRDGAMSHGHYAGGAPNYWPNSLGGPTPSIEDKEPALDSGSAIADRYDSTVDHDDFTQAGNLYRLLSEGEKDRLTSRIAGGLSQTREEVQLRAVENFRGADEDYGNRIAQKLGLGIPALV